MSLYVTGNTLEILFVITLTFSKLDVNHMAETDYTKYEGMVFI